MSPTIAEFLTHGVLPFTGRAGDVERIIRFWRGTFHSARVRSLLISGESGVGKSALLGEAIRRIEAGGGTVIQLRLYPDASASLAPLLSRALWLAPGSRSLLRSEPASSLPSVIAALRRIVRLRPTLLVIDSLRQVSAGTLNDLRTITAALADEPLAIVGTMGVGETPVRAAFEHTASEQIELKGLADREVDDLCRALLEGPVSPEILEMVIEATVGNPLAIRSAIRGAITGGTIMKNELSGVWESRVDDAVFRKRLAADVGALSIGMSLHLTEEERDAARRLARLGEVFSREAAEIMLPGGSAMLDLLEEKGILAPGSISSIPLPGAEAMVPTIPLAFAHSLLHRSLLEGPKVDPTPLFDVLDPVIPLFSIVPFRMIAEAEGLRVTLEMMDRFVFRVIDISFRLDGTPDWAFGPELVRWGLQVFDRYADGLPDDKARALRMQLLRLNVYLLSRMREGPEYRDAAHELMQLTENPVTEQELRDRLFVLSVFLDGMASGEETISRIDEEMARQIDELVEAHPKARQTNEYLYYLINIARVGSILGSWDLMGRARVLYKELLAQPDLRENIRRLARSRVGTQVLLVFDTREEIAEHLQLLEELEQIEKPTNRYLRQKAGFLKEIMRYEEALELADRSLPEFADMGQKRIYDQWLIARIEMMAAFGLDFEEVRRRIAEVADASPREGHFQVHRYTGGALSSVAVRLGNFAAAADAIEQYVIDERRSTYHTTILALGRKDPSLLEQPVDEDEDMALIVDLRHLYMGREADIDAARNGIRTLIGRDPLRSEDLIHLLIVVEMLEQTAQRDPRVAELLAELRDDIRRSLIDRLERLAENRMFSYLQAIIEFMGRYLTPKELKSWRARTAEIAAEWKEAHPAETGDKRTVCVTMFGRIEIARSGEASKPSRGARLRTLLGLMVANQTLDVPLSLQEFCAIAEEETDPERAKNNLHVGIHRLREALGHDAILTESRTPQLNPELVQVDLIDAHRLLRQSNDALQQGHLIRAWSALKEALEITRGEVPYPTLYNSFFEAARQDFELFLRGTTIAVARAFLLEEDAASAAQVLRLAIASMPGDDEISELLSDALVRSGRRAEAHRMRMRSGSEELSSS